MALLINEFHPRISRWRLGRQIWACFVLENSQHLHCRICNFGGWTVKRAVMYLTIDHDDDDVVAPPRNHRAFITPNRPTQLKEDRICWAFSDKDSGNPHEIDIFGGEQQAFSPVQVFHDENCLVIPSEQGWPHPKSGEKGKVRIALKKKKYSGVLRVVSETTNAAVFRIEIDPDDQFNQIRFYRYHWYRNDEYTACSQEV